MFTLHHTRMALGEGLEPPTFWLTARRSTIELPKNTTPLYTIGFALDIFAQKDPILLLN